MSKRRIEFFVPNASGALNHQIDGGAPALTLGTPSKPMETVLHALNNS